jgi:hypothetical protein
MLANMHVLQFRAVAVGFAILLASVVTAAGCSSAPAGRAHTPATLQIVVPEANATTGPNVVLKLVLRHAHLVPGMQIGGKVRPHEGHVHVLLDGQLAMMTNRLREPLRNLAPGEHTVQAEFVASDHLPFANRVVAAVSFTVR